jgi:hypothetical protein
MPQLPGVAFQLLGAVFQLQGAAIAAVAFPRIRRADPHPWGLAEPSLNPVMLAGHSWAPGHGFITITLAYGDPLDVSAPLVEVTTRLPGRSGDAGAPEEALAHLADKDAAVVRRNWLAAAFQAQPPPVGPVDVSDGHLLLGHEPHPVSVLSFGHYQAARFADAATAGIIASRHCPLDQLTLAPVPAIEPYLAGYPAYLRRARHWFARGR